MRHLLVLLSLCALLAGCGSGSSNTAAGGGGGGDVGAAGAGGEQLSGESISELAVLREEVNDACQRGETTNRLDDAVSTALQIASFNPRTAVVQINQADRARNLEDFFDRMAGILEQCGLQEPAQQLRDARYGQDATPGPGTGNG